MVEELSFLERIFPFLRNPEYTKKVKLKKISQKLARSNYKFYKYRSQELTPEFAKFVIEIYKNTETPSLLLQDAEKSSSLKRVVIDFYLSESQAKILSQLSEESIIEYAEGKKIDEVSTHMASLMQKYIKNLSKDKIENINYTYNSILDYIGFVKYDYSYVIKRFSTVGIDVNINSLQDATLKSIMAKSLSMQLKDFQDIFGYISGKKNWKDIARILSIFKRADVINLQNWNNLVKTIQNMLSNEIIVNLIRCIDEKPDYNPPSQILSSYDIVKEDVENLKINVEYTLRKITNTRKNDKILQICNSIFGTVAIPPLEYFNDNLNNEVVKKNIMSLKHYDTLSITKHFLIEFFKKECKDLQDLLLIRAAWLDKGPSQKALGAYQNLLDMASKLIAFDREMSAQGQYGMKLKKFLNRVNDKSSLNKKQCEEIINSINDYSVRLMRKIAADLVIFGKVVKMCCDDYALKESKLILNWKEIESKTEKENLKEFMDESYKKIYYFIQILKIEMT